MTIDLVLADHKAFKPYVKTEFTVSTEAGPVGLTLDGIKLWSKATKRDNRVEIDGVIYPARRSFALTFVGPLEPFLPARTYTFHHPDCGSLEMYLSPFRQDHDCILYETAFS